MPKAAILFGLTLAVALSHAQQWEMERVDSASTRSYVEMARTDDGTLWLAYVTIDNNIRVARYDSMWSYEDIDTAVLAANPPWYADPLSLALGTGAHAGIAAAGSLAEHGDSTWAAESIPFPSRTLRLGYNPAGLAAVAFWDESCVVTVATRGERGWEPDTVCRISPDALMWAEVERITWRGTGRALVSYWAGYSMGGLIDWGEWWLYECQGDSWVPLHHLSVLDGGYACHAILLDHADSLHLCMSESDTHGGSSLTFDGVLLDASSWVAAAVLDSLDRPQAVWIRPEGIKHGYRTGYWHIGVLPGTSGAQWCDMVLDSVGQPIVAFVAQDNSIWLAHGVDVVGAEEEQKVTGDARRAATLVRGELRLHGAEPAELLDLSGRRVRHLEPGANDVRGLRAGVYFLRERTGPAVRVIVTQ